MKNISIITELVLLGLFSDPQIQTVLFVLFLGIYLLTLVGNTVMILIIKADARLHTPMYFFPDTCLSWISALSHCAQNATKLLVSEEKHLSVGLHHLEFLFHSLRGTAACLLSTSPWPRTTMLPSATLCSTRGHNRPLCTGTVSIAWAVGFSISLMNSLFVHKLHFCGSNIRSLQL